MWGKMTNVRFGLSALIQAALSFGATKAEIVSVDAIRVESSLAALCRRPRCPSYGLAPGCPPHAMQPSAFRHLLAKCVHVVIFKRDVPMKYLLDERRPGVARSIHLIAAGVEQQAGYYGYEQAEGFAAGSCKEVFCPDHQDCRVLRYGGKCRYPEAARPSLSAVGVDVTHLCDHLGWELNWADKEKGEGLDSQKGLMLGLVLLK